MVTNADRCVTGGAVLETPEKIHCVKPDPEKHRLIAYEKGHESDREMFAVMFAVPCPPMGSNAVRDCQCRSTKQGSRMGSPVFSVRCSTN